MMKTKKSNSYDQHKLKIISDNLCDNIEKVLEVLDITEYRMSDKMVIMNCPIHGGDNPSALNLYHTGDSYRGNWKCRTHNCEETFKSSILGFIRGCLSNKKYNWSQTKDKTCTFKETIYFAEQLLGDRLTDIKVSNKDKEKTTFVNTIKYISDNTITDGNKIHRDSIINSLKIPSQYFLDRGFTKDVLIKYDVGDCINNGKPMSGRAVVPVYDNDRHYMVGCTGRSIYNRCVKCNSYHNNQECPSDDKLYLYSKWKHNSGFKTQNHLYNYWFAKDHIQSSKSVIIVESPGNVWRLEESGIHNSVAIFGCSMSDIQKILLDISGAMNIYTIMDNDDAGKKAAQAIYQKCHRTYNVYNIDIDNNDIASMSVDEVSQLIKPKIKYE